MSDCPAAVLLDWDNTLIDSWACIQHVFNETLRYMGHQPWTVDQLRTDIRYSLRDRFPTLFGDRWLEAQQLYYRIYADTSVQAIKSMDGAEELLKTLTQKSIYLGVVSNKQGDILRAEAAQLGWGDLFGQLVGAGDAYADKPSVAPVDLVLAPLSLTSGMFPPQTVWFVGDTGIDMQCAHAAGCLPILIGSCDDAILEQYPPSVRVADCHALTDMINHLGTSST